MTSDFSGINPKSAGGDDPLAAARQLEAYFLRRILSEVGPSGAFGGKGVAGSTFRGMFEEALADAVSETGQVGLAETIANSMAGEGGRRASADLATTAMWADLAEHPEADADPSSDPDALADLAVAERLRRADTSTIDGPQTLNPGQKGPTYRMGGE